jgi:hypothetical protein
LWKLNRCIGQAERHHDDTYLSEILADDLAFQWPWPKSDDRISNRLAEGYFGGKDDCLKILRDLDYETYDDFSTKVRIKTNLAIVFVELNVIELKEPRLPDGTVTPFGGLFHDFRLFRKVPKSKHGWQCWVWIRRPHDI